MSIETELELYRKNIITRAKRITLKYFLLEDSNKYGIKITGVTNGIFNENRAFPLNNTKEEITDFISVMAKNLVFPVSLFEILDEIRA